MAQLIPMLKKLSVGFALLLFGFSLFLGIDRFVHRQSTRFAAEKITSYQPYSSEWELPQLSEEELKEVDSILDQKFTYYGKGSQAYVFISEDKQFILKFLKQTKLRPKSWLSVFPFSMNPYYQEKLIKQKKAEATFLASKIAFVELKKETGLIYAHLNRDDSLQKKVTVFDRFGEKHLIDVGKTTFYIQKRAQLIYARISELMHQGDLESAKNVISSVFQLIDFLGQKGIVDNDPILRKNFGLIEDIAVQIDIGKMRIDPVSRETLAYKQEVASITHSFRTWLNNNYPPLIEHFDTELRAITTEMRKHRE